MRRSFPRPDCGGGVGAADADADADADVALVTLMKSRRARGPRNPAARAARITQARQREGRIDFLTVLDAERTLASADSDLVAARRDAAFAQVDLFRALGGGWNQAKGG